MEETNKLLKELIDLIKLQNNQPIGRIYNTRPDGEWCICGAWKQYGVPDNHHCSGYRVTCSTSN